MIDHHLKFVASIFAWLQFERRSSVVLNWSLQCGMREFVRVSNQLPVGRMNKMSNIFSSAMIHWKGRNMANYCSDAADHNNDVDKIGISFFIAIIANSIFHINFLCTLQKMIHCVLSIFWLFCFFFVVAILIEVDEKEWNSCLLHLKICFFMRLLNYNYHLMDL